MIDKTYRTFRIPKKNGKYRIIQAPNDTLKEAQRSVASQLQDVEISQCAMGFVRRKSIVDNARIHYGQRKILAMDIKDFFPSITEQMVCDALTREGFGEQSAEWADICTLDGRLPQGSPASPILSNIVCKLLDADVDAICTANGLTYTRYADDITISSSNQYIDIEVIRSVRQAIMNYGFLVNNKKTKFYDKGNQMYVTGISVCTKLNAPRVYVKNLRACLHSIEKGIINGTINTPSDIHQLCGDTLSALQGKVNYICQVNPLYRRYKYQLHRINSLLRERSMV